MNTEELERLARAGLDAQDGRDIQGMADADQALWEILGYERILDLISRLRELEAALEDERRAK